ncbi:MAG: transglycosylase domain-containing protein [Clostridia bacterium]|nr:transglycosylase domain-containing protein [Clostridia bacterium]
MKKFIFFILKILIAALIFGAFIIGFFILKGQVMFQDALKEHPIEEKVAEIRAKDNYTYLEEVPQVYKDAVVAVEDHRFYSHNGVDNFAIVAAIINNLNQGKLYQGGSTITQQICKNVYFSQDRTLERKFAEMFMAMEFEKLYSKDEILEIYINTCFYGNNCDTLKEATRLYYDKEPMELTDYEAILIAGIPNAPSLYNPIHSMELAKQRQKQVLIAMVDEGFLTKEEKDRILQSESE